MADSVKLIECPRDAWQGLKGQLPTHIKVDYLKALISAGFKHIDAASFVSPKAVPQMADSEEVLNELDPPDDVEIIGIVVNEKGAQRAINTNAVRTLGFPYSVSPTFLRNNQHQTLEEAIDELEKIKNKGEDAGLDTVVYISMAFGNPYGDPWNPGEVVDAVDLLEFAGLREIDEDVRQRDDADIESRAQGEIGQERQPAEEREGAAPQDEALEREDSSGHRAAHRRAGRRRSMAQLAVERADQDAGDDEPDEAAKEGRQRHRRRLETGTRPGAHTRRARQRERGVVQTKCGVSRRAMRRSSATAFFTTRKTANLTRPQFAPM